MMNIRLICFYVHFFTCIKKRTSSEAAKKSRSLGPPEADFPALLEFVGSLKLAEFMPRAGVLRQVKLLFQQILCCLAA
jgi:hypothetical protein